jgi:glycosyltransferase involved in cell wall biosynthesis
MPATHLGFIGNYRHLPNADALAFLLNILWPALRQSDPAFKLFIAGTAIPAALRDSHAGDPNIHWMEDIADLRDFYGKVGVFINPVVSGRGLRTKLVEAAAYGRPLVSTALGAEGLDDLEISKAETPEEFVRACRLLAENVERKDSVAAGNRRTIESAYDIGVIIRNLERILA